MANCLIKRVGNEGLDCDNCNATALEVLSPYTFGTKNTTSLSTGTMINNKSYNTSVPLNGSVAIPRGYHNGTGVVTYPIAEMSGGTYSPAKSDTTVPCAGKYLTGNIVCKGDQNLKAENIKIGTKLFGITGTFRDTAYNTAYDGSKFSPLFAGGVKSDVDFYYYDYSISTGTTAKTRHLYSHYYHEMEKNGAKTSGELEVYSYDYGASDLGILNMLGYVTANPVDLSPYSKFYITSELVEREYSNNQVCPVWINFINPTQTDGTYVTLSANYGSDSSGSQNGFSWTTEVLAYRSQNQNYSQKVRWTVDISSLSSSYYIVFCMRPTLNSTNDNHYKWYRGRFTEIRFS